MHVHEPFAPSAASAALRHSHALNVGSFHSATASASCRPRSRAGSSSCCSAASTGAPRRSRRPATCVQRFFPGEYQVIPPGADLAPRERRPATAPAAARGRRDRLRRRGGALGAAAVPARAAQAAAAAALGGDDLGAPARRRCRSIPLARAIRDRVRFVGPEDGSSAQFLARAQVVVAASHGAAPVARHAAARHGRRRRAGGRAAAAVRGGARRRRARACCSSRATPRR